MSKPMLFLQKLEGILSVSMELVEIGILRIEIVLSNIWFKSDQGHIFSWRVLVGWSHRAPSYGPHNKLLQKKYGITFLTRQLWSLNDQ